MEQRLSPKQLGSVDFFKHGKHIKQTAKKKKKKKILGGEGDFSLKRKSTIRGTAVGLLWGLKASKKGEQTFSEDWGSMSPTHPGKRGETGGGGKKNKTHDLTWESTPKMTTEKIARIRTGKRQKKVNVRLTLKGTAPNGRGLRQVRRHRKWGPHRRN